MRTNDLRTNEIYTSAHQCSPKKMRSNDPHINEFTLVQYALKEIHTKVISHGQKKIDWNSILIRKSK